MFLAPITGIYEFTTSLVASATVLGQWVNCRIGWTAGGHGGPNVWVCSEYTQAAFAGLATAQASTKMRMAAGDGIGHQWSASVPINAFPAREYTWAMFSYLGSG
jgi:hypothetical protein